QQGQDHRCTQHQPDADGCGKVASGTRRRRRGLRTVRGHTGFALALAGRHHSDLEKFSFLVLDQFIDLTDVAVREAVELLLSTRTFVLADLAVLDEPVDLLLHLAPDVAHGDLAFFTLLLGELGHLLAALLGHLRNHYSDDLAVVGRVDPEVGVADRGLHRLQLAGVVRLDDHHPRFRHVDAGQLVQRSWRTVVVDGDSGEHRGIRAPGADAGELLPGHLHRLLHLLLTC